MNLLKTHKIAFIPAFIIGLLIVLPTLSAILKISIAEFKGIYPMFNNDEEHYTAKIREAYDGHYNFGNTFLKEYKDLPALQQPLAEIILGNTARIFHLSVPALSAINDFLLPFIGVIILYAAFFSLIGSRKIAALSSFLYYFTLIFLFGRPINPQFSFIFLFLSIFLIHRIIAADENDNKKILRLNFLLAIVFGIEFYTYPFCWTATLVLYSMILFLLLIKNKSFLYLKGFLLFLASIAVISVPYILNLKQAVLSPFYLESNLRWGFLFTRIPSAYFNVGLMFIGLTVLFLSCKYFENRKTLIFLSSLGISGIILNWQNVITGQAFSFSMHYYWVIVLFLFLIITGVFNVVRKEKFSFRICIIYGLIILSLLIVINREKGGIRFVLIEPFNSVNTEVFRKQQELAALADWFNKNTPKESAVYYLGDDYNWFLPIYTHNNVYYNGYAANYLLSDSELEDRWVMQNFFTDLTADYIKKNQGGIWLNKFIESYQNREIRKKLISLITGKEYTAGVMIPDEYIQKIFDKQAAFRKSGFGIALKKYEVDYVLVSKDYVDSRITPNPESFDLLSLISKIGDNFVYEVR